jgi:hypothetical protein
MINQQIYLKKKEYSFIFKFNGHYWFKRVNGKRMGINPFIYNKYSEENAFKQKLTNTWFFKLLF